MKEQSSIWRQDWIIGCSLLFAVALFPSRIFAADAAEQWRWSGVERVVAISDVHGAYGAMVGTLKKAGILDDSLHWSAGYTHLVITGDLLDRGPDSRRVMDLIMGIEPEAETAGGEVHLLLGNHEVMNLVSDLRYVSVEEYAAFAADESADEREHWYHIYRDKQLLVTNEEALRTKFDADRPAGFFAHRRAFRSDGKYGKWLLKKSLIAVINNTAFVHGGLAPVVADVGLAGINGKMKDELVTYVRQLEVLYDADLLTPAENFYDHASVLDALPASVDRPAEVSAAIQIVSQLRDAAIHDPDSPLWYRGNVGCGPLIEIDRIGPALTAIGASRVVIGHTPTRTRRVLSRLDGRVIEIDTGMLNAFYKGSGNALVMEGDTISVINERDQEVLGVVEHPRRVGIRGKGISIDDLQRILANGSIESMQENDAGYADVKLSQDGVTLDAIFLAAPRSRGFAPELAAYRLDRFLDLGMIPATVSRTIDGKKGTLQFKPLSMVTEGERNAARKGSSGWCPLPEQWNAMYVFDALIYNPGRSQQHMLYSPDYWQLILTGHGTSFDTSGSRPKYLKDVALDIGTDWQQKLDALTDKVLNETLGDVLNRRRLKALARRRDQLLEDARKQ